MGREQLRATIEVACTRKVRETAKAALYVLADSEEEKWIPKSVIEHEDEMDDGTVLLELQEWFAEKEGLV